MDFGSLVIGGVGIGAVGLELATGGLSRSLARSRKKRLPLAELIPQRSQLADGVMRLFNGRLQVSWEITGQDFAAASAGRYAAYLDAIHQSLMKREDGDFERWQLNFSTRVSATRGYIAQPEPADPTSATMAWARRQRYMQRGRQFVTRPTVLTATYRPPSALATAIERFAIEDDEIADNQLEDGLRDFERGLTSIEEALLPHVVRLKRLRGYQVEGVTYCDQLSFLRGRVGGRYEPVVRPPVALVQRVIAGVGDYDPGFEPRIGDEFFKVIMIEDFPEYSFPSDFDFLSDLEVQLEHETRCIFLSPQEAYAKHKRASEELRTLSISIGDRIMGKTESSPGVVVDPVKMQGHHEQSNRMGEIGAGAVRHCEWTSGIIIHGQNLAQLRKVAKFIQRKVMKKGFTARIEGPNAWEALVSLWPGDETHNRSPLLMDSVNMMDGLHLSHIDPGPDVHPNTLLPPGTPVLSRLLTHGRHPVNYVDSVGEIMHVLVLGPGGSTKSTTALAQCAWGLQQYPDERQFIFDQGGSAERYARAAGGAFHRLDPSNRHGFAVFDGIEDEVIRYERLAWLETIAETNNRMKSDTLTNTLWKALGVHARSRKRSMSLFQSQLGVFDPDLAKMLEYYTASGPLGYLLDSEVDRMKDARVNAFELQLLMEVNDQRAIGPVLLHIFDRQRRLIRESSGKGRLMIDEPKDYFKHPILAKAFESEFDKARKNRTGVTVTALRPSDIMSWSIGKTVADACLTQIVFGTQGAEPGIVRGDGTREQTGAQFSAFTELGYTEEDCIKIMHLPQYSFLLRQGTRRVIAHADLDPVELAFVGATGLPDRDETTEVMASAPADWPAVVLERRGLHEAAAHWRAEADRLGWRMPDQRSSNDREVVYGLT